MLSTASALSPMLHECARKHHRDLAEWLVSMITGACVHPAGSQHQVPRYHCHCYRCTARALAGSGGSGSHVWICSLPACVTRCARTVTGSSNAPSEDASTRTLKQGSRRLRVNNVGCSEFRYRSHAGVNSPAIDTGATQVSRRCQPDRAKKRLGASFLCNPCSPRCPLLHNATLRPILAL
jgi:hypothetical protein